MDARHHQRLQTERPRMWLGAGLGLVGLILLFLELLLGWSYTWPTPVCLIGGALLLSSSLNREA